MRAILSYFYLKIVEKRNRNFDEGKKNVFKCPVPVISVGNLSVGGTGKTPFTAMLAEILLKMGIKPAIIGRGYKRKSRGELIVSDGIGIKTSASEAGDEMMMLAEKFNCPVIVHDKKYLAAKAACELFEIDCIIVDDGFQHRYLHRDLDIVLIDETTNTRPFMMPKGRLREPIESLKRANVVVFTQDFDINDKINELIQNKTTLNTKAECGIPYNLLKKDEFPINIKFDVLAVCGIARPNRFYEGLTQIGINIKASMAYNDHKQYSQRDIKKIISRCHSLMIKYIITTEKDMVKLRDYSNLFVEAGIECYVLPIQTKIIRGEQPFIAELDSLFKG